MIVGPPIVACAGLAIGSPSLGGSASGGPPSGSLSGLLLSGVVLVAVTGGSGRIGAMGVNLLCFFPEIVVV